MYKLSLFNNGVETVVHYPSNNPDDPHVTDLPLKEGLSIVDTLSFKLYPNNQGYNQVFELTTKVKAFDLRDNTVVFTGRILSSDDKMDSSGIIYKEITCEGALSFLNDTKLRGDTIYGDTVAIFLGKVLDIHNSKVENDKKISVGNVDIPGTVYHSCEFKSTLAEIISTQEVIGGKIRVREVNGVLYMDWLQSFTNNIIEVSLGINMKDMIVSKDVTSLGTRIIPLGANNLTIENVNGGLDYLDDPASKAIYGTIEKTVEYKDIQDPTILFNTAVNDLSNHTQPSYTLSTNALDLSFITGISTDQFTLDAKLHLINPIMGVDSVYSIVGLDLDLLKPYNPRLTISKKPETLSNAINDLRKSSIQNDGVYNNVQIGRSFGIRATKSDGKTITTMNATEGIKIQTDRGHGLVDSFYVDANGNLKINTYDEITGELTSGLNLTNTKISAVVSTPDGGASWELNKDAFILAFSKAGSGYTEINENGITIYDGRFKIKKGTDTKFYVNTAGRCTADGGFVVNDGSADTSMDANGIHITNSSGQTASLGVSDIGRFFTPGSVEIDEGLDVNGFCHINGTMYMYGSVHVYDNDGYGDLNVDKDVNVGDDINVSDNAVIDGTTYTTDLDVSGSKNCVQLTANYGYRRINAYETAEYYFGDIGEGKISEDECVIHIDDILSECVNTDMSYQVFVQIYKGSINTIDRYHDYFVVRGDKDTEFAWELKAKRLGYENIRLEQRLFDDDYKIDRVNFSSDLNAKIDINTYYSDINTVDNSNIENELLSINTDAETEKYLMEVI